MSGAGSRNKPAYAVPSMREIEKIPPNGYTAVSTFSGCGGSCLGYRIAGFRLAWASEFIPAAAEVYKRNHPDSILDTRDIREVTPEEILSAVGKKVGEIDVFDGSPPCASFSMSGKRESGWGDVKTYSDTKQRVDDLFFEYARLVEGVQPRVFVAENVAGLVRGTAKGYFKDILIALRKTGYRVRAQLLDAQWLGVPQSRKRIIFLGVRNDLERDPVFPKPLRYRYSIRDAIGDGLGAPVEAEAWLGDSKVGDEWDYLGSGSSSKKYFNLVKPRLDRPSPTILQMAGQSKGVAAVTHPTERRKFSIAELRRICAFPDDFELVGTYAQQWERLGRAVPPVMMSHIAGSVRDLLDDLG